METKSILSHIQADMYEERRAEKESLAYSKEGQRQAELKEKRQEGGKYTRQKMFR